MASPLRSLVLVGCFLAFGAGLVAASSGGWATAAEIGESAPPDAATLRAWVETFKASPRGPFERIRWFCADGSVHPPKPYPCAERGGGVQHGEWNERARALRAGGYAVANVLADVDPARFTGPEADLARLKQILIERFLIDWDDGWIFRGARTYRGALQVEDEEAGALRLVRAMLADPAWREPARFLLLRESVRLLPIPGDEGSASEVRQLALQIAARDESFTPLRAKIHNQPDADDAARVREYAASRGRKALAPDYERLAGAIDALYTGRGGAQLAVALAEKIDLPGLVAAVDRLVPMFESPRPTMRLAVAARLLGLLRKYFPRIQDPALALEAMQVSLALEDDAFTAGNTILTRLDALTRRDRLELLDQTAEALYGIGFLTTRHLVGVKESRLRVEDAEAPSLNAYRAELRYLARVPEWSGRSLAFRFGPSVEHLAPLEPEVHLFAQDRLRGSPLLFYSALIDGLVLDANRLAGIQHVLFGRRVGAGLRALNPGLTRGTLRSGDEDRRDPDGIYLLPETTSDLPSVAGILTQGEGSSLSHVQLLARNLGIPNVVVGEEHLPAVRARLGSRVVLAVSPNGVVQLVAYEPRWDAIFGEESERQAQVVIRPDLEKLDLESTEFLPLASLRATDSGRTSGPKGANLGELKHTFGDRVPNGFVIPFGAFRELLDQPIESGGPSVFEWMKAQYDAIGRASGDPVRQQRMVSVFLARLRDWILNVDTGPAFRDRLRAMLKASFGPDGSYGVFVRSDTNVEDLPGFTGAGLNLTVPNVVGFEAVLRAIHAVWASPFEERAYGWRQSHMTDPEYVFPAVVIQLAFPAEKSGVMVTADVEGGEPGWITVAVSEGPGGGVEGQSTESLRIDTNTGEVRFLAQATEPDRPVLRPAGGVARVPASGAEAVLQPGEIDQLVAFARRVHERFPSLRDENGRPVPADVEFAFRDGRLALLQLRPFVESARAQGSAYLARLDAGLRERGRTPIALDAVPGAEAPEETP
jgi:hypothetical protein